MPPNTLTMTGNSKETLAECCKHRMNRELLYFYLLFATIVLFVYYAPPIINKAYFIVLLILFWKSKKNYFWFALVLVIIQQPGTLFHGALATDVHRIPMYNLAAGISLSFYDLFFLSALAKAIIKGNKTVLILYKPLFYLLCYLIFLLLISVVVGTSNDRLIHYARIYTSYTLFISLPFLVYKKREYFQLMYLLFPIVFLIFTSQAYTLLTIGNRFESFFLNGTIREIGIYIESGSVIRPTGISALLVFTCFICSLFFLENKDYHGSRRYLYVIIAVSFLIMVISATRSWIVMITAVFLFYFIFLARLSPRFFIPLLSILTILCATYLFVPKIQNSVDNSIRRTSTLISLAKGDLSLGGTSIRITQRLPNVLKGIKKNPIIGLGISDTYTRYGDYHVANFNLILQAGLIGLLFFINLWIKYFRMVLGTQRRLLYYNSYRRSLSVLAVGFAGLLLLQLTTYQLFGFTGVSQNNLFIIIFYIVLSEFMVRYGVEENMRLIRLVKMK